MEQKIKIVLLVEFNQKILFYDGRSGYELLMTELSADNSPEDRINSFVQKKMSIVPEKIKVLWVDRGKEELIIIYKVFVSKQDYLKIFDKKRFVWVDYNQLSVDKISNFSKEIIINYRKDYQDLSKNVNSEHKYILYTDGGSRGNPGHSAIGYAIFDEDKKILEGNEYIGVTNSAMAEYQALARGIESAIGLKINNLECRIDNLMIVRQMNHRYQIKNRELWPINQKITDLIDQFDKINFVHIKREFNQIADDLVNKALDAYLINK